MKFFARTRDKRVERVLDYLRINRPQRVEFELFAGSWSGYMTKNSDASALVDAMGDKPLNLYQVGAVLKQVFKRADEESEYHADVRKIGTSNNSPRNKKAILTLGNG